MDQANYIGKVLIIDDTVSIIDMVKTALAGSNYQVLMATSGSKGINIALKAQPDLILLDVLMPEMDGYETCTALKNNAETQHIPVIFMSALSEVFDKVKAFSLGAVDYVTKPLNVEELMARVNTQVTLHVMQQQLKDTNKWLEQEVEKRTHELLHKNQELQAAEEELKATNDILKENLETLKEKENLLKESQKVGKVGSWELNFTTNHLKWSDQIFSLMGCEPNSFAPDYDIFLSYIHPDDRKKVDDAFKTSLAAKNEKYEVEHRYVHNKTNNIVYVKEIGKNYFDKNGNPIKSIGLSIDITEQKLSEIEQKKKNEELAAAEEELKVTNDELRQNVQKLTESEFKLNAAQKLAKLGHYNLDFNTGLWTSSKELDAIFGIDENFEKNVEGWVNFIHPDFKEIMLNYLTNEVLGKKQAFNKEYKIINQKTKKTLWVHGLGELSVGKNGKVKSMIGSIQDITKRKKISLELEQLLEKNKSILRAAPVGICVVKNHKFTELNPTIEKISGYTANELMGRSPKMLHRSNKELKRIGNEIYDQIKKQGTGTVETKWKRKDGKIIDIRLSSSPIDLKDHSKGLTYSALDITEQKEAEINRDEAIKKLSQERDLLHALMNNIPDTIYFKDTKSRFTRINKSQANLLGINSPDEAVGKTDFDFLTIEHAQPAYENEQHIVKTGKPVIDQIESVRLPKQGFRHLSTTKVPIFNNQKEIVGIVGVTRDITEHKQVELALKESEERFSMAMQASNDGLFDWNLTDNSIYFSPVWKKILGYKNNELPNDFSIWEKLTHPDDVKKSWQILEEHIAGKRKRFELEFRMQHKKGHWVPILSRAGAIFNNEGKAVRVVGTHFDLTEIRKIERQLIDSEDLLKQSQSVANVGSWSYKAKSDELIWSDETYRIFGYPPHSVKLNFDFFTKRVHPDDRESVLTAFNNSISNKEASYQFEHKLIKRDTKEITYVIEKCHNKFNTKGDFIESVGMVMDITQRKIAEIALERNNIALQKIIKASSNTSGQKFFNAMAMAIHETSESTFSYIGKYLGDKVETLALVKNGQLIDNITYALKNTPCNNVCAKQTCIYTDNIQAQFPNDKLLVDFGIEAYVGTPVFNHQKKCIAVIVSLYNKPLKNTDFLESLFQLFSDKVAGEIERIKAETNLLEKNDALLAADEKLMASNDALRENLISLEESEARFKALHNASFGGIVIHDMGLILECNQGLSELTGYKYNELIGMNGLDLISDDERQLVLHNIKSQYEKPYEAEGVRKDGTKYPLRLEARQIPYHGKNVRVVEFRDITEQKEAEKQIRENEDRYRNLQENMQSGVLVYNPINNGEDFEIIGFNKSGEKSAGISRSKVIGCTIKELYPGIEKTKTFESLQKVYKTGKAATLEAEKAYSSNSERYSNTQIYKLPNGEIVAIWDDVTDKIIASRKLKESEERYRSFIANSFEGVSRFELNPPLDLNITVKDQINHIYNHMMIAEANDSFAKMYGFKKAKEIVDHPISYLWGTLEEATPAIKKFITGGYRFQNDETHEIDKNNNSHYFLNFGEPQFIENKLATLWITQIDITEKKTWEAMLEESETRFKGLFEHMQSGVAIYKPIHNGTDFQFIAFNKTAELITNSKAELVKGQNLLSIFPKMDKTPLFEALIKVHKTGKDEHLEPFYYKDKIREGWRENSIYKLPNGEIVAIFDDVTERIKALQNLKQSEERFRTLANNIPGIVFISNYDEKHTPVYVNDVIEDLTGYKKELFINGNKTFLDTIHPDDYDLVLNNTFEFAKNKKPINITYRVITNNNEYKWVEEFSSGIYENNKLKYIQGVVFDITDRKQQELLNQSRIKITEYEEKHDTKQLITFILDEAEKLTDSKIGFYHFFNEDKGIITLQEWSSNTKLKYGSANAKNPHYPLKKAGVWSECIHKRKAIIHNNYENLPHKNGLPKGHIAILREAAIPVIRNNKLVAVLGVGNKPGKYTSKDVKILEQIADNAFETVLRKNAEKEIIDERNRSLNIIEGTNAGTWQWNIETGETVFNERWAEIIGYKHSEIEPTNIDTWIKFTHPDDLENSNKLLTKHFKGELDYYECEARMKHKDGSWRWVLDRGKVISWTNDGKPILMFGTHVDITNRKEAEERFKRLSDASFEGIALSQKGKIIDINKQLAQIYEYTIDEFLSLPFSKLVHPDDIDMVKKKINQKSSKPYNHRGIKKDGSVLHLEVRADQTYINNEEYRITVIRDITRQHETQKQIIDNEQRFKSMFYNNRSVMLIIDPETGDIIDTNEAAIKYYGYSKNEFKSLNINKINTLSPEEITQQMQAAKKRKVNYFRFTHRLKSGAIRHVQVYSSPLKFGDKEVLYSIVQDIEHQYFAENALLENKQQLQLIFDSSPAIMFLVNEHGKIIRINQTGLNFLQIKSEDSLNKITGDALNCVVAIQSQNGCGNSYACKTCMLLKTINSVIQTNKPLNKKETRLNIIQDKKIKSFTILVSCNIATQEPEKTYLVTVDDITERKQAELALKKSETRFRTIIESANDAIFIAETKSGEIVDVNQKAEELIGYSREILIGMHQSELHSTENKSEHMKNFSLDLKEKDNPTIRETFVQHVSGIEIPVEVSPAVIKLNDDKEYLVGFFRNITKRKQAEEALIESESRFKLLVDVSNEGIILHKNGIIIDVNPAFCNICGYSEKELIGYSIYESIIPDDEKKLVNSMSTKDNSGNYEIIIQTKSGNMVPLAINSRFISKKEKIRVASVRDVTAEKQIQQQILQAIINTEENERKRVAQELHDGLGPVLSTVKLFTETFLKSNNEAFKTKIKDQLLIGINEALQQVSTISNNLSPHVLNDFGLKAAIERFIEKLHNIANTKFKFTYNVENKVSGEIETTLYRVTTELINNSLKYAKASLITITISYVDGLISLIYTDNGKGFDFNATKDAKRGMGLFNIVNRVNSLNGRVDFKRGDKKGIQYNIEIPTK